MSLLCCIAKGASPLRLFSYKQQTFGNSNLMMAEDISRLPFSRRMLRRTSLNHSGRSAVLASSLAGQEQANSDSTIPRSKLQQKNPQRGCLGMQSYTNTAYKPCKSAASMGIPVSTLFLWHSGLLPRQISDSLLAKHLACT